MPEVYTAAGVYAELQAITEQARTLGDLATDTSDEVWKIHPLAIRYRELMRVWWSLPNNQVAEVLYGVLDTQAYKYSLANRLAPATLPLLTCKGQPRVGWYPSRTDLRVAKVTQLLRTGTDETR